MRKAKPAVGESRPHFRSAPDLHGSTEARIESAVSALRARGQRVTSPRRSMLGILASEHGPFSAEELHQRLPAGECDLVTVYRSLSAMEEINIVRRCDFGDGIYRYEFNQEGHHHHHIICRSCRSVRVIEHCVAEALEGVAREMGYSNVTHVLEIFGTCPKCQREEGKQGS
jgi:Fur family ferric uptake transcriptional regulator